MRGIAKGIQRVSLKVQPSIVERTRERVILSQLQ